MKALPMDQQEIKCLQQVARELTGDVAYRMDPQYGYLPASFDADAVQWGSVEDAFNQTRQTLGSVFMLGLLRDAGDRAARIQRIQSHIGNMTDFHSFSFLRQGTGTVVLLGKSDADIAVLRISAAADAKCNKMKDDCVRGTFPGLLQGIDEPFFIDNVIRVETLPFVEVKKVFGITGGAALHQFFSGIAEGTCFAPSLSEVAVLPDKTILILDPGECPYREDYWEQGLKEQQIDEEESFRLVERRLAMTSAIPESLKWLTANGTLKQDLIYESSSTRTQSPPLEWGGPEDQFAP